jgi:membrane-associated protease RseP (regulator of RpoE activity)
MYVNRLLAALSVVLFAGQLAPGNLASGQGALDRLEATLLQTKPATTAPGAAAPQPYLGFTPNEKIDDGKGVRVDEVKKGGPAELGGLKAGDLITAMDGKPVKNLDDFDAIFNKTTVGQKLAIAVDRAGKRQTLLVTLGTKPGAAAAAVADEPGEATTAEPPLTLNDPATPTPKPALDPLETPADPPATPTTPTRPAAPIRSRPAEPKPLDLGAPPAEAADADPADTAPRVGDPPATLDPLDPAGAIPAPLPTPTTAGRPSLGITVVPLTEEARATYGLTVRRGALITNVRPGSPADTAGLPVGGVVVALDGKRIDTADELVSAIRVGRVGQEIELTYYQGDDLARKTVRLAPAAAGIAAAPTGAPPVRGGGIDLGIGGADRPLLNKVENLVEGITNPRTAPGAIPRGPSTVYDPAEMAALRSTVLSLEEKVTALEERIKLLEAKLGNEPPVGNP